MLNERLVAVVAKAGGAKHVELPTFAAYRTRLDRELEVRAGPRRTYDTETAELIAAIGLGK